jgi:hypothetical protein
MSDSKNPGKLGPGGTPPLVPTPKPIYPDTPWWASLIAVFVTAIISILGTAYAMGGAPPVGAMSLPPAASLVVDTITYFPHILLLFGVLADMFTYDGVWSIPSLVGILSIFLNYFMKYFWLGLQSMFTTAKKVASTGTTTTAPTTVGGAAGAFFKNYDGCSVQGFEGFATEFAPQTLVVTATVFCYYIFDLVRNRGWLNSLAAILIFGLVYVGQVAILSMTATNGACGTGSYGGSQQALMALFEGIVFGGSAYGIVQTYYPTRLPTSTISPFPRRSKADLTLGPDGKMYDADGYPFIVLPNGQTVPDLSTQQAKLAFASAVGNTLGTGAPAVAPGCSA